MSLKPRLKPEVNYWRRLKIREYDLTKSELSRSAFVNAVTGGHCEVVTIHKVFNILGVPESERRGLIVWE